MAQNKPEAKPQQTVVDEDWRYIGVFLLLLTAFGLAVEWTLDEYVLDNSTLFKTTLHNMGAIFMWVVSFVLIKIGVLILIVWGLYLGVPKALATYKKWKAEQEEGEGGEGI
jgi:drug/metabolite transporter (DMT)-like permease